MEQNVVQENGFSYIETNPGKETLVLLHVLLGTLSNFNGIVAQFGDTYNIVFPMLPIFDLPLKIELTLQLRLSYQSPGDQQP